MSKVEKHTPREPNPFAAGQAAYRRGGDPHKANPYKAHQSDWKRWVNGWQSAQLEDISTRELPEWAKEPANG